jgi:hypothetical protein
MPGRPYYYPLPRPPDIPLADWGSLPGRRSHRTSRSGFRSSRYGYEQVHYTMGGGSLLGLTQHVEYPVLPINNYRLLWYIAAAV